MVQKVTGNKIIWSMYNFITLPSESPFLLFIKLYYFFDELIYQIICYTGKIPCTYLYEKFING